VTKFPLTDAERAVLYWAKALELERLAPGKLTIKFNQEAVDPFVAAVRHLDDRVIDLPVEQREDLAYEAGVEAGSISDADRAVLALGRAVQQITADWVVVDEIYRRAANVLPEWSYEEARRALTALRARQEAQP
jgi:hypothetical protein